MRARIVLAAIVAVAGFATPAGAASPPTDPLYAQQWGHRRIATTDAWDTTRGADVTIAIVDSGIDATHPDLISRVDLEHAWDFVGRDAVPEDPNGHGTHVAGIAAATADDGIGIAGVAPAARILPVRVLDEEGRGTDSGIAGGIIWAVDHGADVINLSLGSASLPVGGWMDAAVGYATARGVVVIGIAHNQASPYCRSPAFVDPAVLCVGATNKADRLASFSNYGARLDIVAPGDGIISSVPGGRYATWSGTSMAGPHVSGVAALLVSMGATAAEAGLILRASAEDLGTRGYDPFFGWGLVDAQAALAMCADVCARA